MQRKYPKIRYTEQCMREGMQIEDADIPVLAKLELLNALSETGLKEIMIGSFVSPKYTPQMAHIDEIVTKFRPKPGVVYTALALNERGVERAKQYSPPLTIESDPRPQLRVHQCDVFARRNTNRSQMQEMELWPKVVATAVADGVKEGAIGTAATFGSNFVGDFGVDVVMMFLEKQHAMWDEVGIKVTAANFADPMGWCHPVKVEELFGRIKRKWPEIKHFGAHLHNSRGMAITSAYAAIKTLDENDTIHLEGTIGGVGGCPYCGNGRSTGMMPTEDLMHMLEGMGIETGVDLGKLIDCVWMLEKMIGRQGWGHVSRCGPRPTKVEELFDPNAPFVETVEQAEHFRRGRHLYEGCIRPWRAPIESPYLDRVRNHLPAYESDGGWPWTEPFFPRALAIAK